MLNRDEIARSLTGAWALFLDRPDALHHFDISLDGFWRSFRVVVLVLPMYVLTSLADRTLVAETTGPTPDAASFLLDNVARLGLDWIALPIVLALAAQPLGITRNYSVFIIARNWGSVIATAPFGAVSVLLIAGLIGPEIAHFLMLAALMVALRYNYLIARRALDAAVGFAVGIVVLDLAISLTIALTLDAVFGI